MKLHLLCLSVTKSLQNLWKCLSLEVSKKDRTKYRTVGNIQGSKISHFLQKANIRGWQLANFFSLGSTALASDIVEYGVIDKDSGSSTSLEIVVRAVN